ncbi:hypothetical protein C0J52_11656 [Blattella germanica]|nr:hypothetical protein C0J52_11656 [Blattella germanica]
MQKLHSIKVSRLKWVRHVKRLNENKVLRIVIEGKRRIGHPRTRWKDCVVKGIRKLGIRN